MYKRTLLLLHGGPGFDDSYFYPYLSSLSSFGELISYTHGETIDPSKYSTQALTDELDSKIHNIKSDSITVIAHSFASVIALGLPPSTLKRIDKLILSNWVANNLWIEEFYTNFPEESSYKSIDLKTDTLRFKKYYFTDTFCEDGIFEKIKYNNELYTSTANIYQDLNLDDQISYFRDRIFSIGSQEDKIIPNKHLIDVCSQFQIPHKTINGAGHFPFIEKTNDFITSIEQILKKGREFSYD